MKIRRELNNQFWTWYLTGLAVLFTSLVMGLGLGLNYPILYSFFKYDVILIITSIIITWIAHPKRQYALAVLIPMTFKAFVLTIILLPACIIDFSRMFFVSWASIISIIAVYIAVVTHDIINWDKRRQNLINSGKLNLLKERFYVFKNVRNFKDVYNENLKKYGVLTLVFSQALAHLADGLDGHGEVVYFQILALLLTLVTTFMSAVSSAMLVNLYRLQKERQIILKSEFADKEKYRKLGKEKGKDKSLK